MVKKSKTILILEDDKNMQFIYKELLNKEFNLKFAEDANKARKILDKTKIDLLILDIILPKESGDNFLLKLKKEPKYKDLKIVAVTALGNLNAELKRIDPSIICLGKPFEKKELVKIILKRLKE